MQVRDELERGATSIVLDVRTKPLLDGALDGVQLELMTLVLDSGPEWATAADTLAVRVDEDFGTIRVSRVVSALDAGRLYNPKLADSQFKGGIVMGIGMALLEEGITDPRNGRILSANLADYRIATNADTPHIEAISVGIPDYDATPLGGKAVGELAIVGVAPAIANAVFHATGKRIRRLPITLESLM